MPAYQQMGHHSENLLWEPGLASYAGAILSPVNYSQVVTTGQVAKMIAERSGFEAIFDPQLYVPTSQKGELAHWDHYPADVESADMASPGWWEGNVRSLVRVARQVGCQAVASPAIVPKVYTPEFFITLVSTCDSLVEQVDGTELEPLQTVIVGMPELSQPTYPLQVASIVSRTRAKRVYLVLFGDTDTRRELSGVEELKGAMQLVQLLENSGLRVLVSHCSSDLLLWKTAGATSCASGKFFNLRRFTRSRFDEDAAGGGGQQPYLFEEGLVAFLRESDVLRVRKAGLISTTTLANPFASEIFELLDNSPGEAWLGLSWRQFLYWFAEAEGRLTRGLLDADHLLSSGEARWESMKERRVLMEEIRNDGQWLRPWRRALAEFQPESDSGAPTN